MLHRWSKRMYRRAYSYSTLRNRHPENVNFCSGNKSAKVLDFWNSAPGYVWREWRIAYVECCGEEVEGGLGRVMQVLTVSEEDALATLTQPTKPPEPKCKCTDLPPKL